MGIYAKVVSVQKEIKEIKALVDGNTKNIACVMSSIDGIQKMIFPDEGAIVTLYGSTKYDKDTIWPAGRYSVDVQAGTHNDTQLTQIPSRKIVTTVDVQQPFCIRAYCGSKGTNSGGGTNPYSGEFKANAVASVVSIPTVSHIFGNAGSSSSSPTGYIMPSGANCLGNGVLGYSNSVSTGAGSCLHFIPVGGTFGTDYLYAFHVASSGYVGLIEAGSGGGSAYGGAASGGANSSAGTGATSAAGGSTPYGNGGAGVHARAGVYSTYGNNGAGIGAGFRHIIYSLNPASYDPPYGGAAYFDGTSWVNANSNGLFGGAQEDGHIIVKYLGPIE